MIDLGLLCRSGIGNQSTHTREGAVGWNEVLARPWLQKSYKLMPNWMTLKGPLLGQLRSI